MLETHALGAAGSVIEDVRRSAAGLGPESSAVLERCFDGQGLAVVSATAEEIGAFLDRYPTPSLGEGEIESLALVMARGDFFCSDDLHVTLVMKHLGLFGRRLSLAALVKDARRSAATDELGAHVAARIVRAL